MAHTAKLDVDHPARPDNLQFGTSDGWWESVVRDVATGNATAELPADQLVEFDTDITLESEAQDLIKGLFGRGDVIALYGPSGAGKTFVTIQLAYAIALNRGNWFDRRIRSVPVLYVGLEGERGMQRRILAAGREYGFASPRFARLKVPAPLDKTERGLSGVQTIVRAAKFQSAAAGQPVGLIIIDTLARAMAGDDENSSQEMTAFIELRIAEIKRQTGAAIIIIHHTGKAAERGMRGSNALLGAVETVLKVDKDGSIVIEKSREGECGLLGNYRLRQVKIGIDDDGDPITTCVVEAGEATGTEAGKRPKRLKPQSRRALEMLHRLYLDGAAKDVTLDVIDLVGISPRRRPKVVMMEALRDKCREARLVPDGKPSSERMAFRRAVEDLTAAGLIASYDKHVWLVDQQRGPEIKQAASQTAQ